MEHKNAIGSTMNISIRRSTIKTALKTKTVLFIIFV